MMAAVRVVRILFVMAMTILAFNMPPGEASASSIPRGDSSFPSRNSSICSMSDPIMNPFHEIRYGQDVIWQIPQHPKAVIFFAHGMTKEPLSYFDRGPNCSKCYGLPEDRLQVLEALKRRYAVIAVKSIGYYWLPWNVESWPPPASQDRVIVTSVLKEWTKEHSLDHLPLVASGHSSGGNFSTLLTLDLDIKCLVLMCTPGEVITMEHAKSSFPPVLFVAMPIDNDADGFYPKIVNAESVLEANGVPYSQVDVWPSPVHPHIFSERIPCLDEAMSDGIYSAYKDEGWIGENGYLVKNPLLTDWEGILVKRTNLPYCGGFSDTCFAQHVNQVLGVSYAVHSMSSSANQVIYNWMDYQLFFPNPDARGLSRPM